VHRFDGDAPAPAAEPGAIDPETAPGRPERRPCRRLAAEAKRAGGRGAKSAQSSKLSLGERNARLAEPV
jgi:hypothetical protein